MSLKKEIKNINTKWRQVLLKQYKTHKKEWTKLEKFLENERNIYSPSLKIFPPAENIFKAFTYFEPEDTKVVILGQDCYHGEGQAMGLCFSVPIECKVPPSLKNIYKELKLDLCIRQIPKHGDLTKWAQQGVLLLNSSLTVREKCPMSHMKYWKPITDSIIETISKTSINPIIYLLWGNSSKNKKKFIDIKKNIVLESAHPSPLSANRFLKKDKPIIRDKTSFASKGWFGCSHFSIVNSILEKSGKTIDWNTSV